MTRNELYPAMTRATDGNHAYVDPRRRGGDPHEVITPGRDPTADRRSRSSTEMIGRDGAARSATTEIRDAQDPALRLGHAAAAYVHALAVGAITVLGPDRVAAITAGAEHGGPRGHRPRRRGRRCSGTSRSSPLDGHDPIARLADAAAERELDTARWTWPRCWTTGSTPPGTTPNAPARCRGSPPSPTALTETPVWATYLAARAQLVTDLVTELAGQVRGWTRLDAPGWAVPYLRNRDLVVDLAVWRAANSVNAEDLRPAGDAAAADRAAAPLHDDLVERCLKVAGGRDDGADRWRDVLAEHGADVDAVTEDEFWPVLVGRLNLAETAGLPVRNLLGAAARQGPLPVEQTAAALWWRLAPHLGSVTTDDGRRCRAPVAAHLDRGPRPSISGQRVAERIVTDRLWPTLVARVDTAVRAGHDPARLVADAAGMLAANLDTVPEHQWATVLLWHLATLTDPAPVDDEDRRIRTRPTPTGNHPPTCTPSPTSTSGRHRARHADDQPAGDENRVPAE